MFIIDRQNFDSLFAVLKKRGYRIVGPTLHGGAIVYDELTSVEALPIGWTDEQAGGTYRLKTRPDKALFGYAVGPQSWKRVLYPPVIRLWQAKRNGRDCQIMEEKSEVTPHAFIGVRACDLHAIGILDKVFMNGTYVDPSYASRRKSIFIVAVNCGQAGGTCFCASMGTGPRATSRFDLALTEILENGQHYFVVEVGSARGAEVLQDIPHESASDKEKEIVERTMSRTITQMGRTMDTAEIKSLLYRNSGNPRWVNVANRCLSCANCTMVCPTCFCSTVEDATDLTGDHAERWRKWDSCFTMDFSYIHGGSIRSSTKARYRQWMTHKLAIWIDQFGTSGCVGCGRCITWCPVGIDITEEVKAVRESEKTLKISIEDTSNGNS